MQYPPDQDVVVGYRQQYTVAVEYRECGKMPRDKLSQQAGGSQRAGMCRFTGALHPA